MYRVFHTSLCELEAYETGVKDFQQVRTHSMDTSAPSCDRLIKRLRFHEKHLAWVNNEQAVRRRIVYEQYGGSDWRNRYYAQIWVLIIRPFNQIRSSWSRCAKITHSEHPQCKQFTENNEWTGQKHYLGNDLIKGGNASINFYWCRRKQ